MTNSPNENPDDSKRPSPTGSQTIDSNNDNAAQNDSLARESELVGRLLLLDAFPSATPERPAVAAGEAPRLFDLDGKPIESLDQLSPKQPVLSETVNANGQREIVAYSNVASFKASKPTARLVLNTEQDEAGSVERGTIFRGDTNEVLSTRAITQDSNTFNLTFEVNANGETQRIVFDGSGLPTQFELVRDGRKLDFKFDDDGNVVDVEDSQNPGEPMREPFRTMFMLAAKQSLSDLRAAQGLPEPWMFGDGDQAFASAEFEEVETSPEAIGEAGDDLATMLRVDTSVGDVATALNRFNGTAKKAGLDAQTTELLKDLALTQATKQAYQALTAPDGASDKDKLRAMSSSLQSIKTHGSEDLKKAFGGDEGLDKLLEQIAAPGGPETVVNTLTKSFEDAGFQRRLDDLSAIRNFPIPPNIMLLANLFSSENFASIRTLGATTNIREAAKNLSEDGERNLAANIKAFKQSLETIRARADESESGKRLAELFGGSKGIDEIVAALDTTGGIKTALEKVDASLKAVDERRLAPDQPLGANDQRDTYARMDLLLSFAALKEAPEERRRLLVRSIVEAADKSEAGTEVLNQILKRGKGDAEVEMIRELRDSFYTDALLDSAAVNVPYSAETLSLVKRMVSLEAYSPDIKKALDKFGEHNSDSAGVLEYARLNENGGHKAIREGIEKITDPVLRLAVWKAVAAELKMTMAIKSPLSAEQIKLAAAAKMSLHLAAEEISKSDPPRGDGLYSAQYKFQQKTFDEILRYGIKNGQGDEIADLMLNALKAKSPEGSYDELTRAEAAKVYLDAIKGGIKPETFSKHLDDIKELVKLGSQSGTMLMVALTSGVADRYNETGKQTVAEKAAELLLDFVSSDKKAAEIFGKAFEDMSVLDLVRDENRMAETVAKLAIHMPSDMRSIQRFVRKQASTNAEQPESAAFKSAIKGLVTLAKDGLWEQDDVSAILNNFNPEVASSVKDLYPKIDKRLQDAVRGRLTEIATNDTLTNEQRRLAIDTFKAVGKNANADELRLIESIKITDLGKPVTPEAGKTLAAQDLLSQFLRRDLGSVKTSELETQRVQKLVDQLSSPNALERENASVRLSEYGPEIIPLLAPFAKGADLSEGSNRVRQIIREVTSKQTPVIADRLSEFLKAEPGKPIDPKKLTEAIQAVDALSQNAALRTLRRSYLEQLSEFMKDSPDGFKRVERGLDELRNLDELRGQLRVRLAAEKLSAGDKEGARALLAEALLISPNLVKATGSSIATGVSLFSRVYSASDGASDAALSKAVVDAGGQPTDLQPSKSPLDKVPSTNSGLRIKSTIDDAKRLFSDFESPAGPHIDPSARAQRMEAIIAINDPIPRREFVGLALEQYKTAANDYERNQVLDNLKRAAQLGNDYALNALRRLSTLDAALRLDGALGTINSPLATTEQKAEAEKRRDEALMDLARHEYATRQGRDDEYPGDAKGIMEFLSKGAASGIAPDQVERVRKQAAVESSQRTHQIALTAQRVSNATGPARVQAMRDLEKLAQDRIGKEFTMDDSKVLQTMRESELVREVLDNLNNPKKAADALLRLHSQSMIGLSLSNQPSLISALSEIGPDGSDLLEALRDGNRREVERIVALRPVIEAIKRDFGARDQSSYKLGSLKTGDVLKALEQPELLDGLLASAKKEAQENQKVVDSVVNDYLLRGTLGKPVMDELTKALPAEDQVFRLDNDAEFRDRLQNAVNLEHLPSAVLKHARTLLSGGELSAIEVKELRKELTRTDAERRANSLAKLNQLSFDNLHTTYQFETVVRALETLEQAQDLQRSISRATKLFEVGSKDSPESKALGAKDVLERLEALRKMTANHPVATEVLNELLTSLGKGDIVAGGGIFEQVQKDLKSGDVSKVAEALKILQSHLPDSTAKLDEYRAARIVRLLGPSAKPAEYERVSRQLKAEIDASKMEGGQLNQSAVDWSQWVKANESVSIISDAAQKDAPEKAKEAVDDLVKQAKDGNPYARAALAALLVGDQENAQIGQWMRNHPAINGNRQIYVPNFRTLPEETRRELIRSASAGIFEISKTQKLTIEETSALALALSSTANKGGDAESIKNLRDALTNAVDGESTEQVLKGIFEALHSDVKGTKALAEIYLRGVHHPEFAKQFSQIQQFANEYETQSGDSRVEASLRILAGIAGGLADGNTSANPLEKVRRDGKEITREKDSISLRARKSLEDAALQPGARVVVVEAILHIHVKSKSEPRLRDNNQMLATLGVIAADLEESASVQRSKVVDELREAVRSSVSQPDGSYHNSASDGFFGMAKHWKQADVDLVKSTFSDAMFRGIQLNADRMSPAHRAEITAKLVENVTAGKGTVEFSTRLNSIRALSAFGKYLNVDQVALLASFGGDKNYNNRSHNVQKILDEFGIQGEHSKLIQKAIANNEDLDAVLTGLKVSQERITKIKEVVAGTRDGAQILEELGLTADQAKLFKARAAEGLLQVLATAPFSPDGKDGPRELAFKAFRDIPWPLTTGETVDGKPQIIESRDSQKLRDALVKYFEGKPLSRSEDLELSDQINKIVENAKLPRPAALIVRKMGIAGGPIENRKEGDPPSILQITDTIVRNYTDSNRSGQDVLRDVVRNLEQVNALPGQRRAEAMGWTKLSPAQQEQLGKVEPSAADKEALKWESLSEPERDAIRWKDAMRIPSEMVVGQMFNNELQNSFLTSALLSDIPRLIKQRLENSTGDINQNKGEIRLWKIQKQSSLDEFVKQTERGANFGNQLIGFFTLNNGIDSELSSEQKRLAESFKTLNEKIQKSEEKVARLEQDRGGMELSRTVADYTELTNRGERLKADQLAIEMWKQHGPILAKLAPQIWRDLTISTDTTLQGASMLKRLHARDQAHWDLIPGYTSGGSAANVPYDRVKGQRGFKEALGLEAAFSTPILQAVANGFTADGKLGPSTETFKSALKEAIDQHLLPKSAELIAKDLFDGKDLTPAQVKELRESLGRGLMQLRPGESLLDTVAMRTHMLGRIDQDPVLMKFSGLSRKMNDDLSELSKMFGAAMKGAVYDESIAVMKEKARNIKEALTGDPDNPVTRQDLTDLADRIKTMEQALAKMKDSPSTHNQLAMDELESRIKTYKGMHNLFNKFDERPKYPEVMEPKYDDKGQLINQNKQVSQMLDRVLDGGLTAATFTNWCKENGVLIGVTILACAATVAACATFGVSSPLAVGLWVAVAGLAAREVTNEILFQVNRNGYTGWGNYDNKGSRIGDWNRKAHDGKFTDVDDALIHLATDVVGPYAFEILRDWVAFVATAGILNKVGGMGAKEAFWGAIIRSAPPRNAAQLAFQAERVAMLESKAGLDAVAKSYLRQFMSNFGREMLINAGFSTAHLSLETGIHKGLGREQVESMGEHGQFLLSFGLSTTLAMGHGALHSRIFRHGSFEPGAKFKFRLHDGVTETQMVQYMKQQGLNVKQIEPGKWEISPIGASKNIVPITMENVARGEGRPPIDLHPEGHPPVKEARSPEDTVQNADGEKWKQSAKGKDLMKQVDTFTEAFMKGDAKTALEVATTGSGLPQDRVMKGIPTEAFDIQAYRAASPEVQKQMLQTFMEQMSGIAKLEPMNTVARYPEVIVKFGDHEFNLRTGKPIGERPPSDAASAEFAKFLESPAGKRLLMEQAISAMEERIHLLHAEMGNEAFSSSYVRFKRDRGEWTSEHLKGTGRGDGSEKSRASLEQELILALYEKGWSLQMLEHHFGGHHQAARKDALNWIRSNEMLANPTPQFIENVALLHGDRVDAAALENCLRSGRLTPEDVNRLVKMLRHGTISGDDINGFVKTPSKHDLLPHFARDKGPELDAGLRSNLELVEKALNDAALAKQLFPSLNGEQLGRLHEVLKHARDSTTLSGEARIVYLERLSNLVDSMRILHESASSLDQNRGPVKALEAMRSLQDLLSPITASKTYSQDIENVRSALEGLSGKISDQGAVRDIAQLRDLLTSASPDPRALKAVLEQLETRKSSEIAKVKEALTKVFNSRTVGDQLLDLNKALAKSPQDVSDLTSTAERLLRLHDLITDGKQVSKLGEIRTTLESQLKAITKQLETMGAGLDAGKSTLEVQRQNTSTATKNAKSNQFLRDAGVAGMADVAELNALMRRIPESQKDAQVLLQKLIHAVNAERVTQLQLMAKDLGAAIKGVDRLQSIKLQEPELTAFKAAARGDASERDLAIITEFLKRNKDSFDAIFRNAKPILKQDHELANRLNPAEKVQAEIDRLIQLRRSQIQGRDVELEILEKMAQANYRANSAWQTEVQVNPTNGGGNVISKTWTYTDASGSVHHVKVKNGVPSDIYDPAVGSATHSHEIKIRVMGPDGKPQTVTVPKGCRIRMSGPDELAAGELIRGGGGIVFTEPQPIGKDAAGNRIFREYRVRDDTAYEAHHARYPNGYLRVSEVHVGADGKPVCRVYLGPDGTPVAGIDGKKIGFSISNYAQGEDGLVFMHNGVPYADLNGIPNLTPAERTAYRKEFDAALLRVRAYHAGTHMYILP